MFERIVIATDRGGHLHNARMLIEQMGVTPSAIVTTRGPEIESLRPERAVHLVPYLFSWLGKRRFFNPISAAANFVTAVLLAVRLRPDIVISLGASNVVFFCWWARILGARLVHVECMNQVRNPSLTGRLLYPFCSELYVQWEDLLPRYGNKAKYAGWVLS